MSKLTHAQAVLKKKELISYLKANDSPPSLKQIISFAFSDPKPSASFVKNLLDLLVEKKCLTVCKTRKTYTWEFRDPGVSDSAEKNNDKVYYLTGDTYHYREDIAAAGLNWKAVSRRWETSSIFQIMATADKLNDEYDAGLQWSMEVPSAIPTLIIDSIGCDGPEKSDSTENKIVECPEKETIEKLQSDVKSANRKIANLTRAVTLLKKTKRTKTVIKLPTKPKVVLKTKVHPIFEQVLFHVGCGDNVMLVGPKGCGKTWLAGDVAKALSVDYGMLSLSGGVTEGKLLGRSVPNVQTGENNFHPAPFSQMFSGGGLFLLDEIDASDPNVILTLNSALANGKLAMDIGGMEDSVIQQHADFHCLAAANTFGSGADRQYVGRNQQDAAFTERFVQIEMDYDEDLELCICPENMRMVSKLHAIRKKITSNRLERSLSTRFITRANTWMQNGKDYDYVTKMLFAGWRDDEIRKVVS